MILMSRQCQKFIVIKKLDNLVSVLLMLVTLEEIHHIYLIPFVERHVQI